MKLQTLYRCMHGASGNSLAHVTRQQITECKIMDAVGRGDDVEDLQNDGHKKLGIGGCGLTLMSSFRVFR